MRPPTKQKTDFEQVKVDEWIPGIIEEVKLDAEHKKIYLGKVSVVEAIRFKFKLDGYQYPHYSRWLTYTLGEKSNLFLKIVEPLVEGAKPDMKFDLDELKDMKIKTMWSQNEEFQNLEMIRPLDKKLVPSGEPPEDAPSADDIEF